MQYQMKPAMPVATETMIGADDSHMKGDVTTARMFKIG